MPLSVGAGVRGVGAGVAGERLEQVSIEPDQRTAIGMLELRVEGRRDVAELAVEGRRAADVALGADQRASRELLLGRAVARRSADRAMMSRSASVSMRIAFGVQVEGGAAVASGPGSG